MKSKMGKWIVISLILAGVFCAGGLLLFSQSGKLKTVSIKYDEKAKLSYSVNLNNNNYYSKSTLGEGMQYISSIINSIDIIYNYDVTYDDKVTGYLKNDVTANIKIVDETNNNKVIYEKNEDLKNDKNEQTNVNTLTYNQTLHVDFQKYNSFATEFKSKYGIPADAKLVITFNTTQVCHNSYIDDISRTKEMTVEIPLSEQMITIKKSQDSAEKSSYAATTSNAFSNKLLFILSIAAFVISGLLFVGAIIIKIKKDKLTSDFDKEINKILKHYDSYITESTGTVELSDNVIYVMSFKELLDVRNNVEKAIIFNKVSNKEARFIIFDENQDYCYSIRNEEF